MSSFLKFSNILQTSNGTEGMKKGELRLRSLTAAYDQERLVSCHGKKEKNRYVSSRLETRRVPPRLPARQLVPNRRDEPVKEPKPGGPNEYRREVKGDVSISPGKNQTLGGREDN
ncbi:hypothetical protein RUM44_006531 [Polyplax serrata]|uniref:Uncharacterized protein n=1 Tax=Polyplax serrata TaxID=468196 RepID=A0ABR1AID1_POLSC